MLYSLACLHADLQSIFVAGVTVLTLAYMADNRPFCTQKALISFSLVQMSSFSMKEPFGASFLLLVYMKIYNKVWAKLKAQGKSVSLFQAIFAMAQIYFVTLASNVVFSAPLNMPGVPENPSHKLRLHEGNISHDSFWTRLLAAVYSVSND